MCTVMVRSRPRATCMAFIGYCVATQSAMDYLARLADHMPIDCVAVTTSWARRLQGIEQRVRQNP